MILHIELESHTNLEHVREFLTGNATGMVLIPGRKEAYEHIKRVLRRFSYWRLGKADKGLLRCYLLRTTGLSRAQLARLVARYLADGELRDRRRGAARPFPAALRAVRHLAASRDRRATRDAFGAGHAQDPGTGLDSVPGRAVRAPGGPFERATCTTCGTRRRIGGTGERRLRHDR